VGEEEEVVAVVVERVHMVVKWARKDWHLWESSLLIRPKRIYFPEHFCYCFSSNLCVFEYN
jgi:hypothetical protein